MFVSIERLFDRSRQPRSRALELAALRARLREQAGRASAAEISIARQMRRLREELSQRLAGARACGGCTSALGGREGAFDGGLCCSGDTADVFSGDEVAALAFAGTRPRDLRGPRSVHAGCAFRGASGCTLVPIHRPNVCARYLCSELRAELAARGELLAIDALSVELTVLVDRFSALRAERISREREVEMLAAFGLAPTAPAKPTGLQ